MNWKTLAKRTNSLPDGWSTADEIAADLDCEPNEVSKILASAIRDGLVEKQNFPHWQPGSRQLLYQTGYRQIDKQPVAAPASPAKGKPPAVPGIPAHLRDRVRKTCIKFRHLNPCAIADRCRWRGEPRIKTPAIRAMLDSLTHNSM